jgi:hypothetical protein
VDASGEVYETKRIGKRNELIMQLLLCVGVSTLCAELNNFKNAKLLNRKKVGGKIHDS